MAQVKWLCCVLFILVMLLMTWHGRVSGQTKKDDTYLAQQGIRAVKEVTGIFATKAKAAVDVLTKAGKTAAEAAKSLGKLMKVVAFIGKAAPFLGVAGFLLPMIMGLIGGESGTTKLLKEQFFKVNEKLDKLSNKLDKIDSKITFENQRAAYIDPQEVITFSYDRLQRMIRELGTVKCDPDKPKECNRKKLKVAERFLKDFQNTELALHKLFSIGEPSLFKDPLMQLFRKNYDCDIPKLAGTFEKLWGLSRKGQMVVNMKEQLSGSDASIVGSTDAYMKMMYKFRQSFYTEINECRAQMFETNKKKNLYLKDLKANEDKGVGTIKKFLEDKYPWLKWVSLKIFSTQYFDLSVGLLLVLLATKHLKFHVLHV